MDMTPILEVRELQKTYRRGGEVTRAVDGVSLTLQPGESVGIIGESGSGKSTLARCITGLERPTSGRVLFRDKDVANRSDRSLRWFRREVQPVFQDPMTALDPRWTVRQLILEPLKIYNEADREPRLRDVLGDVGLNAELLSRRPRDLSGGERQRVAIARAIVLRPSVLVLDEPTASVDMSMRRSLLALLKRLQTEHGLTYLFISHDIRTIEEICSRTVVMYRGRVAEQGPTAAVLTSPGHIYTQVLVSAIPRPERRAGNEDNRGRLRAPSVPGQLPSDAGCLFADRCPMALPECGSPPPVVQISADHVAACVRAAATEEAI
jgi:oligopeptide/dipeptide ABC transporter ATP-binding protein